MAISDSAASTTAAAESVQIWLAPHGRMGLWPATGRPLAPTQIRQHLQATVGRNGGRVTIRLLCDPALTIAEWAPVAIDFSRWADEIRIGPLARDEG